MRHSAKSQKLWEENFDKQEIIRVHREAAIQRMADYGGTILLVQDTTSVNYNTHVKTEGIGYIGDKTLGVNIHSCLAVSADGLVLGSLDQSDYNRAEGEKLTVNYFCIEIKTVETGKVVYKNRRDNGQNGYQREC